MSDQLPKGIGVAAIGTMATTMPAPAARLNLTFDADRIIAELSSVRNHTWGRQRPYDKNGVGPETDVDWRCLALRSPGGDPNRTDPGGPSEADFADTPWLKELPYIRDILNAIPAPLHAVRLMALGPDAVGSDHTDPKYGPYWGVARLHIPVETNEKALLILDGNTYNWQPGEFWFGDFSRTHRVENRGAATRTHMVIDVLVVPGLAAVFPDSWHSYFQHGSILYNRPECIESGPHFWAEKTVVDVPSTFLLWEESFNIEAIKAPCGDKDSIGWVTVCVLESDTAGPVLGLPDGRRRKLIHLGHREYRFSGWSEERTIQLRTSGPRPTVVLRVRNGNGSQEMVLSVREPWEAS